MVFHLGLFFFFFCLGTPVTYIVRGGTLGVHQAGAIHVTMGTKPLVQLSASFQSLPQLPIMKLGPSGADCWVGGFVYVLGPCGSVQ